MAFVNDFLKSLAMPIGDLAKWLENNHQVPVSDTIEKWNEITGMQVVVNNDSTACEEVEDQTVNICKKNSPKNNALIACQHVFIAGNRKGQQCTTKPKGGNDRCSAHKIKVKKEEQINFNDEPEDQVQTPKKRPVKKIKSREIVKTDSESEISKKNPTKSIFDTDDEQEAETVVPPVTKPKKKIPISDSESESEDKKPASKKKSQKKIPSKGTSEDSDSD